MGRKRGWAWPVVGYGDYFISQAAKLTVLAERCGGGMTPGSGLGGQSGGLEKGKGGGALQGGWSCGEVSP